MKRNDVVKYVNKMLKLESSVLMVRPSKLTPSIEIIIKDKFLTECSFLNKTDDFYEFLEKILCSLYNIKSDMIHWNNIGNIFSIWIDSKTSWME